VLAGYIEVPEMYGENGGEAVAAAVKAAGIKPGL
jgi:hypothetical protein